MAQDPVKPCACQSGHGGAAAGDRPGGHEPLTYSLSEAAQRIGGVSARWLADRLRDGELTGYKLGRQWRMSENDIRACIERSRVVPGTASAAHEEPSRPSKPKPNPGKLKTRPTAEDQFTLFPGAGAGS